nr:YbaB/EbfC family nucleoid-associated protein [Chloroflexota bacterium]
MGSKGKGSRMRFQPGASSMMKQMQELQAQILQAQEELAQETVTVSVGGAVTVVMDGQQQVRAVTIHPDAVDPNEIDLLQDMIVTAMNEALKKSRELADQKMASFTGPLRMAGLM